MKESIEKRIAAIKEADEPDKLKKCLCPFFDKGGHPDCLTCRQTEADLDECRDYYLERIRLVPMDLWSEEFDKLVVQERETLLDLEEIVGIGITCDNCYMYDKCPLYKKGFACGIKWDTNKPKTPTEFMDFLINAQYERVKRAAVFEKIDGGVPDAGLSGEMDRLHDLVASKIDMGRERLSINVEASGAATPAAASGGGGILAKLFGGGAPAIEEKKPIAIAATPESREGIGEVTEFEEVKEAEKVKVPRQRKTK